MPYAIPPAVGDAARLASLRATGLLDTPPEPAFDRLTALAARCTGAPAALLSLVDADRQFFKSTHGLPPELARLRETPLSHCLCRHEVATGAPLVIDDARVHPLSRENGAVRELGVGAYAGVPVRAPGGHVLGSLCVVDFAPRAWAPDAVAALRQLADAAGTELALRHALAERERTERALRESEARLEEAQAIAHVGSWSLDVASGRVWWSDELYRLYGRDPADGPLAHAAYFAAVHADDRERVRRDARLDAGAPRAFVREYRVVRPDGAVRTIREHGERRFGPGGALATVLGTAQDVTAQAAAEAALRASEERFRGLVEAAHEGVWALDVEGRTTYANPRLALMLGVAPAAMRGRAMADFVDAEDRDAARAMLARRPRGAPEVHEFALVRADGERITARVSAGPLRDAAGAFVGAVALVSDITRERRVERALRESEDRLRLALDVADIVAWERDLRTDRLRDVVLPRAERAALRGDLLGDYATFLAAVHPHDRERVAAANAGAVASCGGFGVEFRTVGPSGEERWHHAVARVLAGGDGAPQRMIGVVRDVTAQRTLEAQLRQSQKMEAVGRLAGGVAHDFNNLLMVIGAGALFAREAVPAGSPALQDLSDVDAAVERAAALTNQLLAFSRQQAVRPARVELNRVVASVERMLGRLLGEDVRLATELAGDLGAVRADTGQLEQVLMNLAVNARDAMPRGGALTMATANVDVGARDAAAFPGAAPGAYVALRVRDTGVGMDAAVRARAFEPFFTTKEPGRGTGLGLATVYGIVRQAGGHAFVESAPGRGTTFTVLLPRVGDDEPARDAVPVPAAPAAGSERVLLVEDEPALRASIRRMLERGGYRVAEARHGREALSLLERHGGAFDLVLSDVVMPELGAEPLLERLRARWPALRILLMSGYGGERFDAGAIRGRPVLAKPFAPAELLRHVRACLDG